MLRKIKTMAKKILNEAENTAQGRFETICDKCDCHFTFSKVDTYTHRNDDYGGGSSLDNYVDCPKCNHSIMVNHLLSGNTGGSFMTFWSHATVQDKVLKNINVQQLRSTADDNEFKRMLIKQLT
jgi:hypothetical protein